LKYKGFSKKWDCRVLDLFQGGVGSKPESSIEASTAATFANRDSALTLSGGGAVFTRSAVVVFNFLTPDKYPTQTLHISVVSILRTYFQILPDEKGTLLPW